MGPYPYEHKHCQDPQRLQELWDEVCEAWSEGENHPSFAVLVKNPNLPLKAQQELLQFRPDLLLANPGADPKLVAEVLNGVWEDPERLADLLTHLHPANVEPFKKKLRTHTSSKVRMVYALCLATDRLDFREAVQGLTLEELGEACQSPYADMQSLDRAFLEGKGSLSVADYFSAVSPSHSLVEAFPHQAAQHCYSLSSVAEWNLFKNPRTNLLDLASKVQNDVDVLEELLNPKKWGAEMSSKIRAVMAKDSRSVIALEKLAFDPRFCETVLANPYCPVEVLKKMGSRYPQVAALHPKMSFEGMAALGPQDWSQWSEENLTQLLEHPCVLEEHLAEVKEDSRLNPNVREHAAYRYNQRRVKSLSAKDFSERFMYPLPLVEALHPETSPERLRKLYVEYKKEGSTRASPALYAAAHPNAPLDVVSDHDYSHLDIPDWSPWRTDSEVYDLPRNHDRPHPLRGSDFWVQVANQRNHYRYARSTPDCPAFVFRKAYSLVGEVAKVELLLHEGCPSDLVEEARGDSGILGAAVQVREGHLPQVSPKVPARVHMRFVEKGPLKFVETLLTHLLENPQDKDEPRFKSSLVALSYRKDLTPELLEKTLQLTEMSLGEDFLSADVTTPFTKEHLRVIMNSSTDRYTKIAALYAAPLSWAHEYKEGPFSDLLEDWDKGFASFACQSDEIALFDVNLRDQHQEYLEATSAQLEEGYRSGLYEPVAVLCHPNAPSDLLVELYLRYTPSKAGQMLMLNPNTPEKVLNFLEEQDEDMAQLRKCRVEGDYTETLKRAIDKGFNQLYRVPWIPQEYLSQDDFEVFYDLRHNPERPVRDSEHPLATQEQLWEAWKEGGDLIQSVVRRSSSGLLRALARDAEDQGFTGDLQTVLEARNCPKDLAEQYLDHEDENIRLAAEIASGRVVGKGSQYLNFVRDPETLWQWYEVEPQIVAENPHCPEDLQLKILEDLQHCDDRAKTMRIKALARSQALTAKTAQKVYEAALNRPRSEAEDHLVSLICNPKTPAATYRVLEETPHKTLKLEGALAANVRTRLDVYKGLRHISPQQLPLKVRQLLGLDSAQFQENEIEKGRNLVKRLTEGRTWNQNLRDKHYERLARCIKSLGESKVEEILQFALWGNPTVFETDAVVAALTSDMAFNALAEQSDSHTDTSLFRKRAIEWAEQYETALKFKPKQLHALRGLIEEHGEAEVQRVLEAVVRGVASERLAESELDTFIPQFGVLQTWSKAFPEPEEEPSVSPPVEPDEGRAQKELSVLQVLARSAKAAALSSLVNAAAGKEALQKPSTRLGLGVVAQQVSGLEDPGEVLQAAAVHELVEDAMGEVWS